VNPIAEQQERICPNCGDGFTPGGRGLGKRFCSPGCTKAFHNRANGEGAAIVHLVKAWIGARHAPKGSAEAALCRKARGELTEIATLLVQRDRAQGRPPATAYVAELLAETRYIDRTRK
jgi:hypothetical protein